MISLLVAMDQNNVIGFENDMPWHLPADLKFFKQKTTGHKMVMGRKTFDAIGRVLPNRENIVLTRKTIHSEENITIIHHIDDVYRWSERDPDEEIFVIGGGHIFEQILPKADRIYMTRIEHTFNGDTYFPELSEAQWMESSRIKGVKDDNNPYDYYFIQYDRKD